MADEFLEGPGVAALRLTNQRRVINTA